MRDPLLSLEVRRALRDRRMEQLEHLRQSRAAEAERQRVAEGLRSAAGNQLYAELGAATTVLPREHEAIESPWSRREAIALLVTTLVAGLVALLLGSALPGLIGAALGAGTLLLARRLAGSTLESGAEPRLVWLLGIVLACSVGYGFIVSLTMNGWIALLSGLVAGALLFAAALAFCSPALSLARESWRREELRLRRISFEREAAVHGAHAERLRRSAAPPRT